MQDYDVDRKSIETNARSQEQQEALRQRNARIVRLVEARIAAWPAWKQQMATEDGEFLASYRTQMAAWREDEE